jgi:hypothetical protein
LPSNRRCWCWRRVGKGSSRQRIRTRTRGAILNTQIMAKRLLADRDGALAIARGLNHRPVQPKLLSNAAQIALTFDDDELADACLANLPSGGDFDYFRGMLAFLGAPFSGCGCNVLAGQDQSLSRIEWGPKAPRPREAGALGRHRSDRGAGASSTRRRTATTLTSADLTLSHE